MKCKIGLLLALAFIFSGVYSTYAQDPDTLDVVPGYETLNLAVEGDTTAAGEVKNPDRVYRLQRDAYYLLNGQVFSLGDNHLRIVAAEGDGQMPIIIPMVDETGTTPGMWGCFEVYGDGTFKGIYVSAPDNLGNISKNQFRLEKEGGRYIFDRCFVEYDNAGQIRLNADNQTVKVTNSFFAGEKRPFDVRNPADTLLVQNCTFYRARGFVYTRASLVKVFILDHNTLYQPCDEGENMEIGRALNVTMTNNIIIDLGYEGEVREAGTPDSLWNEERMGFIEIDPLEADEVALDSDRIYKIANNVYGWTAEVQAWIDGIDSVYNYVFLDAEAQRFIDTYPNMVFENNIEETPVFSDPPESADLVAYAQSELEDGDPVWPFADRNGIGTLVENPESFGPAADPYDFDYNTDALAYTHAEGGFPAGDLNWFPDKKAEWETWIATDVEKRNEGPTSFNLVQNFPNPFNPKTAIFYQLKTAAIVDLTIYNSLGQRVQTLVNGEKQAPGNYSLYWNGLDEAGREMASGVYFYQLKADNQVQVKKMMLMR